jgi:hypothetical protein
MSRRLHWGLGVSAAVVFGATLVHVLASRSGHDQGRPRVANSVPQSTGKAPQDPRVKALQLRLAALEAEVRQSKNGASEGEEPSKPETSDRDEFGGLDENKHREQLLARHEASIAGHQQQPVDHKWASTTATSFQADIGSFAEHAKLSLVSVDCRTTTCIATVEWASYENAIKNYERLLHFNYKANCQRQVLLPAPQDRSRPYRETVYFDCAEWRTAAK